VGCAISGGGVASSSDMVRPIERKALGAAQAYPADADLRGRTDELHASKAARRAVAWKTLAKVLAPVPLADTSVQVNGQPATVPLFRTWYAKDDLDRMFAKTYGDMAAADRKARTPITDSQVSAAFDWNATALGASSEQDYFNRLAQVKDETSAEGLGGNTRVVYSPGLIGHFLENYGPVDGCLPKLGTFDLNTDPPSDDNFAQCFSSEFPVDAALVKQSWWRADFGMNLPVYDTSASTLTAKLAGSDSDQGGWGAGTGTATPDDTTVYTVKMSDGTLFRLPALHLVTKELRDWMWITFWWSPDPDSDFGADRPDEITQLGGPWKNYKMCVAMAYDEADPDPRGGFDGSLGDALAAVHEGGGPTWCSNPYLEKGAKNAQTNCIGCHQHAGIPTLGSDAILADETTFPRSGRTKLRKAFPTDYIWSFDTNPEKLARIIEARVNHFDSVDN
jgi:hypothetical protein